MDFKSDDIFFWKSDGRIGSKLIVKDESDDAFETRMDMLSRMGLPLWCRERLSDIRRVMVSEQLDLVDERGNNK